MFYFSTSEECKHVQQLPLAFSGATQLTQCVTVSGSLEGHFPGGVSAEASWLDTSLHPGYSLGPHQVPTPVGTEPFYPTLCSDLPRTGHRAGAPEGSWQDVPQSRHTQSSQWTR